MPIRDVLLTLLILGSIPIILKRPYIGVLVWAWLSYMNPHRMTWGFAYNMPFAEIVALSLFASLFFTSEKLKLKIDGLLFIWILFIAWMGITTINALHESTAMEDYSNTVKIQLLTFITMVCISNQKRIDLLIIVICVSIGYFSVKGGIFTILTGGSFRVYGPPNSYIGENNALALATLMIIPLMYYARSIATVKWAQRAWLISIFLSGISVLGSQSRGALVGIIALGGYFWKDTKSKFVSLIAIILVSFLALSFMPSTWHERMESIRNYQEDPSAMSRIAAWKYCIGVANARLTGGGFQSYSIRNYELYSSQTVDTGFVAHSIYFSVLGSHGWPGLVMFLLILYLTWRSLSRTIKLAKNNPALKNQFLLARMLKLSLIAYMSGGAFLSLAYFDLPWHIFAVAYLLKHQLPEPASSSARNRPQNPGFAN